MRRAVAVLLAFLPAPAFACKCLSSYPVCREVAASDVVFIGTVESVEPGFLDPWHWRDASSEIPVAEIDRLRSEDSPAAAARLKAIYLRMLGDTPESVRHELEVATTHKQVEAAFSSIAAQGRRARFRVRKSFHASDDDDNRSEDQELTIWNGGGDCGIDFQVGETYLVYAGDDEETGRLQTSICYRTRRLTEAGPDLAYLYFYEDGGTNSSRLEGFVTTDRKQERPTLTDSVNAPAEGVVVGVTRDGKSRYARSTAEGRFIFDGLAAGRYEVTVYDAGFPKNATTLAGPDKVDVPEKGCASAFLVIAPRK
ncbi:MAG TPA: carboxypeptidase-like regulatory domain-containing protein [Bryobacteraceae bacterium]|nr:carboxypeptidase-like regulatory domain-containing protein [Bryobacteraceae bacterium]